MTMTPDELTISAMMDWWIAEHERLRVELSAYARRAMQVPGELGSAMQAEGDALKRDFRAAQLAVQYLGRKQASERKATDPMIVRLME